MDERTRPLLLEFDRALESEIIEILAALRIDSRVGPPAKNFGGDGQLLSLLAEVGRHAEPVLAGAIAAIAVIRRGRVVKIDGFEARGMSVREIVSLLDTFRRHDRDSGG